MSQRGGHRPTWRRGIDSLATMERQKTDVVVFPFLGRCFPWVSEGRDHQAWLAVQRQHEQRHQRDHEGKSSWTCFPLTWSTLLCLENTAPDEWACCFSAQRGYCLAPKMLSW